MNVYVDLTKEFNRGGFRAILSSGQAVVMHKLAVMSKDGDWILKETDDTMMYVLGVLQQKGAHYRFGAPLDVRWMKGGWSSHFEFRSDVLRVRTDFVTRPPRVKYRHILAMWENSNPPDIPVIDKKSLAELKKTNREKDYAVIGELARVIEDPEEAILLSRSARDILKMAEQFPHLIDELKKQRPLLGEVSDGAVALETALDAERRALMHENERRLQCYLDASKDWASVWPDIVSENGGAPLCEFHAILVDKAEGILPFEPFNMDGGV